MNIEQYFNGPTNKILMGSTLITTGRFPIESWKQWETLSDLKNYIINTDSNATAYKGMVVSVVSDSTESNNGVYLIKKVGNDAQSNGVCIDSAYVKLGTTDDIETAISDIISNYKINGHTLGSNTTISLTDLGLTQTQVNNLMTLVNNYNNIVFEDSDSSD